LCKLIVVGQEIKRSKPASGAKVPSALVVDESRTKQGGAAEPSEPAELGKSSSGLQFH